MHTVALLQYEMDALVDALRRDMQAELNRISSDPENAEVHKIRARLNIRLLEALRPKTIVMNFSFYNQKFFQSTLVVQR
ncbi:hypothetical protein ACFQUU_28490 [Herbaspirillum sp. GCM10030257]|uniref:hypothetical protein n=1 Tax=Herbaspirillum sp. GCM10030257 TaxID=3273393 RepID=UPI00360F1A0C